MINKLFIKKLSNKEGKELFKGEMTRQIFINGKEYNLIGNIDDYELDEEVIICSYKTQKPLNYGIIGGVYHFINNNTKNGFIVIK